MIVCERAGKRKGRCEQSVMDDKQKVRGRGRRCKGMKEGKKRKERRKK